MPMYQFEAIEENGKKTTGIVDAENLMEAKTKLVRQSIFLTRITPLSSEIKRAALSKPEVLNFTRELSRLLRAGLPLYESLSAMEEKYRGQKGQRLLLDLCEQVKGGRSFSSSLARHHLTFNLLYTAMISNAEQTGKLSKALDDLSVLLAKQQQVRKQLISALLYPSLLFSFCLIVFASLLFYVIPSLQELFEGRELHPFTQIVFTMSELARDAKWVLLIFFVSIGTGGVGIALSPRWKEKLFPKIAQLPWIGPLLSKVALIRFCRAASTLLEGGVPIVSAFSQARTTMRHPSLEGIIAEGEKSISEGGSIQNAFKGHQAIPPLVPRMIGIAEEAGNLPSMLQQIADIYEEDMERSLAHFSTVAQPVLLLLLGTIIGFVLLSVLLPLTDVSTFAT